MIGEVDPWVAQLRKGTLELCILALLSTRDRYGYEIAQGLAQTAALAVGEGTIYPLLSRLQREGLVSAHWRASPAGPPRKYYGLTPAGRLALDDKLLAWKSFRQAVDDTLFRDQNGNS